MSKNYKIDYLFISIVLLIFIILFGLYHALWRITNKLFNERNKIFYHNVEMNNKGILLYSTYLYIAA